MKVLLINPPYVKELYSNTKLTQATVNNPPLAPAVLSSAISSNNDIKILDLNMEPEPIQSLNKTLNEFNPDYVGITFTTPVFSKAAKISSLVKEFNKEIKVVGGGVHASSFPEDTLSNSDFDIVVKGEGDFTLQEIVSGKKLSSIKGVSFKSGRKIITNPSRDLIKDLDVLPYPSWHLYNLKNYKSSKLISRKNPAGFIETSRGCVYQCVYCNKNIFGRTFRTKSPKRVVDEMRFMLDSGFKEIHIVDDGFSTDINRAKQICALIKSEKLDFAWNLHNGVRVDRVDEELMKKLAEVGCYRVTFGVESGNEQILRNINKNITLDNVRDAVKWSKKYGLEVFGYFMLGLPGETKETMQDTIDFARQLDFDFVKFTITIPLPGTEMYDAWERGGYLKDKNWDAFNFHKRAEEVYTHPSLDWDTIYDYYSKAYKSFYLRPSYISKMVIKSILNGTFFQNAYYFFKTDW